MPTVATTSQQSQSTWLDSWSIISI